MAEEAKAKLASFDDVRLSYWAFAMYKECPQKYLLGYVGRRRKERLDSYWAISGSVIHSLWERSVYGVKQDHLGWTETLDFMVSNISRYYDHFVTTEPIDWLSHQMDPAAHREASLREIEKSVRFLHGELYRTGLLPRDSSLVHSEVPFKTPLHGQDGTPLPVTITGRPDLVFENDDSLVIIDLKDVISRSNVNWRQVVWYSLGVEPHYKKQVSHAGFLLTKLASWSWRDVNNVKKDYRNILTREIYEAALAIRRNPFHAKVSRHTCPRCDVSHLCPEWSRYAGRHADLLEGVPSIGEGKQSF